MSVKASKKSTKAKRSDRPRGSIWLAYLSSILLWACYAPLGWSLLAWIAPWGWLQIIRTPRLGRREYFQLWLSGCVFWLAILQGIRLAYWPLYFGWLALSLYLAVFVPWFVAVTRSLIRHRLPLWLAAPVAWVGLEMARSYLLTGYCANTLGLSQIHQPRLVQLADQLGGYGVSFLVMLVSAAVFEAIESFGWFRTLKRSGNSDSTSGDGSVDASAGAASSSDLAATFRPKKAASAWVGVTVAGVFLVASLLYGSWKIGEADQLAQERQPLFSALLVQENTPTMFDAELSDLVSAWERYLVTTRRSVADHGRPDVIVWPESTFTAGLPWFAPTMPSRLPKEYDGLERTYVEQRMRELAAEFEYKAKRLLQAVDDGMSDAVPDSALPKGSDSGFSTGTYLLVGCDAVEIRSEGNARHNSAMWVGPDAKLLDRYDKMHLVMFGEYIPLGPLLKPLRDAFGLRTAAGSEAKSFSLQDSRISPNICFESMMPRVIRSQVQALSDRGESPDVLVNVSNDSWFRGSSMLDHHLACTMLCAIENRRPILVAANTGISAEIDGAGRLKQSSERFEAVGIYAEPTADARSGLVQSLGYPLGWLCLFTAMGAWIASWFRPRQES